MAGINLGWNNENEALEYLDSHSTLHDGLTFIFSAN